MTNFANLILIAHALYVGIVIFSVPLIIMGGVLHWPWVRNIWFRLTHLLMIAIVVAESFLGVTCPLTTWERAYRSTAEQGAYKDPDFIAAWLDGLLFYHFPHWLFTTAYASFGVVVVSLFFFIPIKRASAATHSSPAPETATMRATPRSPHPQPDVPAVKTASPPSPTPHA